MKKAFIIIMVWILILIGLAGCDRQLTPPSSGAQPQPESIPEAEQEGDFLPAVVTVEGAPDNSGWIRELFVAYASLPQAREELADSRLLAGQLYQNGENLAVLYTLEIPETEMDRWPSGVSYEDTETNSFGAYFGLMVESTGEDQWTIQRQCRTEEVTGSTGWTSSVLYDRSLEKTFQEAQPIVEVETQGESLQQIALEVLHPLVLETGAAEYSVDSGHLWGGEEEFCGEFYISGDQGELRYTAGEIRSDGSFSGGWLMFRARKLADGRYGVISLGGGPLAYGLSLVPDEELEDWNTVEIPQSEIPES